MASVSTLPGLGPAMDRALASVGITTAEQLCEIGGDAAYERLLAAGTRPHFIGYYVLHMAIQGRPWNDCRGPEKTALRQRFDALKSRAARTTPPGIEAELDRIGVGDPGRR